MLTCEGYPGPVMRLLALQERLCREIGALDELEPSVIGSKEGVGKDRSEGGEAHGPSLGSSRPFAGSEEKWSTG